MKNGLIIFEIFVVNELKTVSTDKQLNLSNLTVLSSF